MPQIRCTTTTGDKSQAVFFISFRNRRCFRQPAEKNTFGMMPAKIAEFMKLPNAYCYTGHCFRRSSATYLADSGANITDLKRHGGWKFASVAEGYIEDCLQNKLNVAKKVLVIDTVPSVILAPIIKWQFKPSNAGKKVMQTTQSYIKR